MCFGLLRDSLLPKSIKINCFISAGLVAAARPISSFIYADHLLKVRAVKTKGKELWKFSWAFGVWLLHESDTFLLLEGFAIVQFIRWTYRRLFSKQISR